MPRKGDFDFRLVKSSTQKRPGLQVAHGTKYKYPHTAFAAAKRAFKPLILQNPHMQRAPIKVMIRDESTGRLVREYTGTWGKLLKAPVRKLATGLEENRLMDLGLDYRSASKLLKDLDK